MHDEKFRPLIDGNLKDMSSLQKAGPTYESGPGVILLKGTFSLTLPYLEVKLWAFVKCLFYIITYAV